MKLMTILGTRPEIIRLNLIIPLLDKFFGHILVYTGQNYEPNLSNIFFNELNVRKPDYVFDCKDESTMGQIGKILRHSESVLKKENPDRLLILGDTNSALSSVVAKRMNIPVFHMEAGNRCYDDKVPEEVNRRIVDHCSDVLMPYTERSRENLLREGLPGQRIFVIGNPIFEVLDYYKNVIDISGIMQKLSLEKKKYFLVTLHRSENVDVQERLSNFITSFHLLYKIYKMPIICSLHPRTRSQLKKQNKTMKGKGIITVKPLGLFEFVQLEKNAYCVLSDSGTVQEECCIFRIPNVTLRDVTERPETVESGSNLIAGSNPDDICKAVDAVLGRVNEWNPPHEYLVKNVSSTVLKILLGMIPLR